MKTSRLAVVCVSAVIAVAVSNPAQAQRAPLPRIGAGSQLPASGIVDPQLATTALKKLPIRFEPTDRKGTFLARGMGRAMQLTGRSIDFPLGSGSQRASSIRLEFVGARKSSRVVGVDALPGRINYLYGDDPAKWRTNVPTYARAYTTELYRGIDVEYYGAGDQLEYDLVVQPGARPDRIRLAISGASVVINESGDLAYGSDQRVLLRKPVAYQVIDGDRRDVSVDYHRRADGSFGFVLSTYDRGQPLVIDPIVADSFTFGGNGEERIVDMAIDEVGAVYMGGTTFSSDFPTVNPAETRQDAGDLKCVVADGFRTRCSDGLLAKLRPDGAALEYATYVGVSGLDSVNRIAVGPDHALYFTGAWADASLPTLPTGYFFGKLTPDGSRFSYKIITPGSVFGSRSIGDLAAGTDGSAYVLTYNGLGASEVGTLSPTGENYHPIFTLPTSTAVLTAIAARGNSIFVAGWTSSPEFPVTSGAAQAQFGGTVDGVVMRLNTDGTVVYSTFVGGTSFDQISDLAVDSDGDAYAAGVRWSNNAVCGTNSPDLGFITKLSADGSSTSYTTPFFFPFGPCSFGLLPRIAVDNSGNAYGAICGQAFDRVTNTNLKRCDLWMVGPNGTVLHSELDVPTDVFAVDTAGGQWFGSTTDDSRQDAHLVKFVPLKFNALTTDVSLPVRFASRITWTADFESISAVEYTFLRYSSADGWVVAQTYGPDPSYTWTPASWDVGDHYLCAIARLVASPDISAYSCVQFTINGLAPGEPPVISPAADFNADRRPDLIWINSATGQMAMWNLGAGARGEQVIGGGYLQAPALPAGWRVAGSGDIDGDGLTDLFLQSNTGLLGAWLFNGSTMRSGITLAPGQVGDPNWQIRAVGDLNHDGHPDLIWQYAPTGQVAFWLMNATTAIDYIIPNVMAPGGDWEIVGTGDSNRDGERDIFWQQRSTGTLAMWWMNGTSIAGASLMSASPDPKWRVVAVADVDGDAYSDLVFQHTDTRMTAAWYLQGSSVRNGVTLIPSTVSDPAWKIVGPR